MDLLTSRLSLSISLFRRIDPIVFQIILIILVREREREAVKGWKFERESDRDRHVLG